MPEGIFAQTVSGDYVSNKMNVEDRDMLVVPDITTLRTVPWLKVPTASVFVDCFAKDGSYIDIAPRQGLRNVLALYETKGWIPVVAPEVEFYLINPHVDANDEVEPPKGRLGRTDVEEAGLLDARPQALVRPERVAVLAQCVLWRHPA